MELVFRTNTEDFDGSSFDVWILSMFEGLYV